MQHQIHVHRAVSLAAHMTQHESTSESVHRVQRRRVQIQIKPVRARTVAKGRFGIHRHQHQITIATDNRICAGTMREIVVNVVIVTIGMDDGRVKIPIQDPRRMVEAWSWHRAIQAMKRNHVSDKADWHQHRMQMLAALWPQHLRICQISPSMFRYEAKSFCLFTFLSHFANAIELLLLCMNCVQATTPPELNVIQSPQLFPSVRPVFASRWSSQAPETFLPNPNGKWKIWLKNSN